MALSRTIRRYPLVFATAVLLAAVLLLSAPGTGSGAEAAARWIAGLYITAVVLWTGAGMVRKLRRGEWGLDFLAVIAMAATVAVGEYVAALIIVLMLSGGEALEDYAAGRARGELDALLDRAPQIAHRIPGDGGPPTDIPATAVQVGDVLVIKPSELVPVDAVLLSTEAEFDESSLTGEPLPVHLRSGDPVLSGSLNGTGAVTVRASAAAADSQYQRIVSLVREASQSRAPVVRLADRYAVPFTVVSLVIAGLAWALSGDPTRFAAVLVLATPCPLLIAAPVAFMGGMSRAARSGIIVKGGATLEQLSRVRTAAFDKTGTLTYGRPALVEINARPPFTGTQLLALTASAEQYSSHVLAAALQKEAVDRGLPLTPAQSASEVATHGVDAMVSGHHVMVGKRRFIASSVPEVPAAALKPGQTAVYVGIDGSFAGTLVLSDRPRAEARHTLERLRARGIRTTLMLTGDVESTARATAAAVGITDVRSELLPEDKVRAVAGLVDRPVLMVGDGVNDAPVLAAADVGIAMGARGSTAAGESADAVIVADDLSKVATAVDIGQRTMSVALMSIWLGIGLSMALMLVAAFGFIPPVAGALTQELVDLAAILNALRALHGGWRRPRTGPAEAGLAPSSGSALSHP